jgi:hypothetical protein
MVVVDASEEDLTLLEYVHQNGITETKRISKLEFIRIHNEFLGGDEVAYLSKPAPVQEENT